jgi:hypothetical protein
LIKGGAFLSYVQRPAAAFEERSEAMHKLLALTAAALLVVSSTAGWAQSGMQSGTVSKTPGHMMKNPKFKNTAPGASEFAPGHLKKSGQPASKYTPSHRSTTGTRY